MAKIKKSEATFCGSPLFFILQKPCLSVATRWKLKFDEARCLFIFIIYYSTFLSLQGDHYCACARKWCHFHIFPRLFKQKQKKIKKLWPKMTKIASRGSCLNKLFKEQKRPSGETSTELADSNLDKGRYSGKHTLQKSLVSGSDRENPSAQAALTPKNVRPYAKLVLLQAVWDKMWSLWVFRAAWDLDISWIESLLLPRFIAHIIESRCVDKPAGRAARPDHRPI